MLVIVLVAKVMVVVTPVPIGIAQDVVIKVVSGGTTPKGESGLGVEEGHCEHEASSVSFSGEQTRKGTWASAQR